MTLDRSLSNQLYSSWTSSIGSVLLAKQGSGDIASLSQSMVKRTAYGDPLQRNGTTRSHHRMGTLSVLKAWSQPTHIQAAALFIDEYERSNPGLVAEKRRELRLLIGLRAERLVYLFDSIGIGEFNTAMDRCDALGLPLQISGIDANEKGEVATDPDEAFDLAVLQAAGEANSACDPSGAPGVWLASVSRLCGHLQTGSIACPPIFNACRATITEEDERQAGEDYRRGLAILKADPQTAIGLFAKCSKTVPWVAEPFLWQSFLWMKEDQVEMAKDLADTAAQIFSVWGTAWDKRIAYREWLWVAARLREGSSARVVADVLARVAVLSEELDGGRRAPSSESGRLESFLLSFGSRDQDFSMRIYPGISMNAGFDPSRFPIVSALEESFPQIKAEIEDLESSLFFSEAEPIERVGQWDVLFLSERGRRAIANCARCPTITRIIDEYDPVLTMAGSVYVSKLHPNTEIKSHVGPTNMRVRCHLGIKVPMGDCGLRSGGEEFRWETGKCITFNDCMEHEAWNRTSGDRIVLIVDLWHPDLTSRERDVLKGIHQYAALYAKNLVHYWAANKRMQTAKRVGYD